MLIIICWLNRVSKDIEERNSLLILSLGRFMTNFISNKGKIEGPISKSVLENVKRKS